MMKKFIMIPAAFLGIIVFFFASPQNSITASATGEIHISVFTEEITSANYSSYYNALFESYHTTNQQTGVTSYTGPAIQLGDYALSITISDNTGYCGSGVNVYYDSSLFEIYGESPIEPYYLTGNAAQGLLVNCNFNPNSNLIGVSTAGLSNNRRDGILVTVFAKRLSTALDQETPLLSYIDNVGKLTDSDTQPIEHIEDVVEETEYRIVLEQLDYILGDINGDGIVDTDDAVILLNVLNQYGTITEANAAQAFANCAGMFATDMLGDPVFILDAADANQDSSVNQPDASAILTYYTMVYQLELPNNTPIGTLLSFEHLVYVPVTST